MAAAPAGTPVVYTLNKGEAIQFSQDAELNGSPIQADQPVGVWGGSGCMNIDVGDSACDAAHQQLPAVRQLGSEYAAVRYGNRIDGTDEAPPWRVLGAVAGTNLTYEPAAPAGAPTTLAAGQLAVFYTSDPFVVRSQDAAHPFYVSGHMTGQNFHGGNFGTGDPEFVNTVPTAQYLSQYVFMTDSDVCGDGARPGSTRRTPRAPSTT